MAIISFFMFPEPGHLNRPIKLAKSLRQNGHQAYFFGLPGSKEYICREGMEFIPVFSEFGENTSRLNLLIKCILHQIKQTGAANSDWQALLIEAMGQAFTSEERMLIQRELNDMIAKIKKARIDLFFADYGLLAIAFMTSKLGINSALLNPTLLSYPLLEGPSIDFLSILNLPIVYLCPPDIEILNLKPRNYPYYYIEPSVDLNRTQDPFQWDMLKENLPLLFCSFGSQSRVYSKAVKVIQIIIDAMKAKPEWQTVLYIGNELKAENFGSLGIAVKAPNIWWSIQSLGKTTDLTDQKRIFTD
jgi:zeaxanthin glucosyltransferase